MGTTTSTERIREIYRITMALLNGGITREEHKRLLNEIIDPQEKLPLGVGAATERPERT